MKVVEAKVEEPEILRFVPLIVVTNKVVLVEFVRVAFVPFIFVEFVVMKLEVVALVVDAFEVAKFDVVPNNVAIVPLVMLAVTAVNVLINAVAKARIFPVKLVTVVDARVADAVTTR